MALSKIDVANFLDGTIPQGNVANASLGAVTALPAGVGGKVLQVVTGTTTTRVESSSSTYADTNLSVTITPSSSSNKIYIIGTQAECFKSSSNSANSIHIRLLRDATEILDIVDRGLLTASAIENMCNIGFNHLDSPATTSAITYKTQFHNQGNYSFASVQQQGAGVSTITAMEIEA
jgi:hypothetical protein